MMATLAHFFSMGGHGIYVWTAYGSVLGLLGFQGFIAWYKWRKDVRKQP